MANESNPTGDWVGGYRAWFGSIERGLMRSVANVIILSPDGRVHWAAAPGVGVALSLDHPVILAVPPRAKAAARLIRAADVVLFDFDLASSDSCERLIQAMRDVAPDGKLPDGVFESVVPQEAR